MDTHSRTINWNNWHALQVVQYVPICINGLWMHYCSISSSTTEVRIRGSKIKHSKVLSCREWMKFNSRGFIAWNSTAIYWLCMYVVPQFLTMCMVSWKCHKRRSTVTTLCFEETEKVRGDHWESDESATAVAFDQFLTRLFLQKILHRVVLHMST